MRYQLRRHWALCALFFLAAYAGPVQGQSALPSSSQLQTIQLQARAALFPMAQPNTIELDGTFQSEEGSLTQNGNVHLTVGSDGSYLLNISRTSGPIGESRTVSNGFPACTWTDQEGAVHKSSFVNCLAPAWFFPGLSLLTPSGDASAPVWVPESYSIDSLGNHLRLHFGVPVAAGQQEDPQLLSPVELVLAPDTRLPRYTLFIIHPDNPGFDADIPVAIAYSDYRNISGAMIPFRIQRYVNGTLVLELTISTASVQ